jgi:DNA-binding MarR family transcriptional regulator
MPQTRRTSGRARSATVFRISDSIAAPAAERLLPLGPRVPSFLSYRLRQICLGIMDEVLRPADLKPVEYATLTILDDEPGLDQHQLAERLGIDKMSMSKLADKLELRGLVARQASAGDRRVNEMHLTIAGRRLRRKLQPAALAAQQRILEPLHPGERRVFVDLLSRVIEGHRSYAQPGNGRRRARRQVQASS